MLGIKESLDKMAKASKFSRRWYGNVLRKEDENVTVKALKFEMNGNREEEDRNKREKSKQRMR